MIFLKKIIFDFHLFVLFWNFDKNYIDFFDNQKDFALDTVEIIFDSLLRYSSPEMQSLSFFLARSVYLITMLGNTENIIALIY